MKEYQKRIPLSRRTGPYRQIPAQPGRAVLFTPRASLEEPESIETLVEPGQELSQTFDLTSRQSSRRTSQGATLRPEPTQQEIINKFAAAGIADASRGDLERRFGKRKAAKLLAGEIGWEDGRFYDMGLAKACYRAHRGEFWLGASLFLIGCEFINMRS